MKLPLLKFPVVFVAFALVTAVPAGIAAGLKSNAKQKSDLGKYDTDRDGKIDRREREAMRVDKEQQQADHQANRSEAEKKKEKRAEEEAKAAAAKKAEKKVEEENKVQVIEKEADKPQSSH